ncbi:DNA-binding transcriptional regulator YhcF (GntR family) [Streptomyces achromogenes]|uniref:DNA-binding transcriptional regulator YhcF (GntR family) n=1 Tax=Streptomyces achromogenes TaxID=67255 RepID=A0ABU0QDA6_STRAH|nr:DNA-binding transcriptional regulator YhcF (GntR family) [Streptomyces achromogenes]
MAVEYRIDRRSGVPAFQQIVQQTKQALRLGVLVPGDRLPTAKDVAETSAVNPNTTLKAYRELEREGLVEPRPGLGTFVRRTLGRAETGNRLAAVRGAGGVDVEGGRGRSGAGGRGRAGRGGAGKAVRPRDQGGHGGQDNEEHR